MEPNRNDQNNNNKKPGGDKPKGIFPAIVVALVLVLIFSWVYSYVENSQYTQTKYSDFRAAMEAGQLHEVELRFDRVIYQTKEEALKDPAQQKTFFTGLPSGDILALANELYDMGVIVDDEITEDNSMIQMILYYVIMFAIFFFFMRMLTRRMSGEGMMGGFGKSKAKVYMEKQTGVTFKDVAGQD